MQTGAPGSKPLHRTVVINPPNQSNPLGIRLVDVANDQSLIGGRPDQSQGCTFDAFAHRGDLCPPSVRKAGFPSEKQAVKSIAASFSGCPFVVVNSVICRESHDT